jgi:hypothetical protein
VLGSLPPCEKRHELPAPHSINSSARSRSASGIVNPSRLGGRCYPLGYVATSPFPSSLPCVGGQHLPHLGLSNPELPRNSRGRYTGLEGRRRSLGRLSAREPATCVGRTLEDSFLFRDPLGVGSSDALAARLGGSLPRRFASSSAAARSDASSPSSSRLSALARSFGARYRRNDAAMSTAAAFGEETWLAGDASENRSGVGC